MSEVKHTPGPFIYRVGGHMDKPAVMRIVSEEVKYPAAVCDYTAYRIAFKLSNEPIPEYLSVNSEEEMARFLTHAGNCHAEMLEALETLERMISNSVRLLKKEQSDQFADPLETARKAIKAKRE